VRGPSADRSIRNRPETTDTVAPSSRHLAIAVRTTMGRSDVTRSVDIWSAHRARAFERADVHEEGRQSCGDSIHLESTSPTVRIGACSAALFSAKCSARSVRRNSAASRDPWKAKDRWTDVPVAGSFPTTTRISKTPGRRSRSEPRPQLPMASKVGPSLGSPRDPYYVSTASAQPLTRSNAQLTKRARRDSNPQPSDP
jgi:hypothetical protein